MGSYGILLLCGFTCLLYGHNVEVALSFPPISGGNFYENKNLQCVLRPAFDLSRQCLLARWGIKGQCHNCKNVCIAGLLPCQFAYRRKCKQISQEAVGCGNPPGFLQAAVRLRTSIVYLGIQNLDQHSWNSWFLCHMALPLGFGCSPILCYQIPGATALLCEAYLAHDFEQVARPLGPAAGPSLHSSHSACTQCLVLNACAFSVYHWISKGKKIKERLKCWLLCHVKLAYISLSLALILSETP